MATKLFIERGENPDIVLDFFQNDAETLRLNLTGAVITVTTNIPGYVTPAYTVVDLVQGIISVPISEAMSLSMKVFTEYNFTVRAVDIDGEIHLAKMMLSAK